MGEAQEEAERARINAEIGGMCYNGNTVSYIYDKMRCYGDQVMMAFSALRLLGWVDKSNGNRECAVALKEWSENLRAQLSAKTAECERMRKALVERGHAEGCESMRRVSLARRCSCPLSVLTPPQKPDASKPRSEAEAEPCNLDESSSWCWTHQSPKCAKPGQEG